MNSPTRILTSLSALEQFTNDALRLKHDPGYLNGFHFNRELLKAAAANTYIETVVTGSDSMHLAMEHYHVTDTVKGIRDSLFSPIMIAFDYTHEDFYGDRDSLWIHGRRINDWVHLPFLKQIFDHRTEEYYDWCFAEKAPDIALNNVIAKYRFRWRIKTMFRVQDKDKKQGCPGKVFPLCIRTAC